MKSIYISNIVKKRDNASAIELADRRKIQHLTVLVRVNVIY